MKEIDEIRKHYNFANYVTVLEMYLKDNLFLERKLKETDLKKDCGHFGCAPAINFIYAHLLYYAKRKNKKMKIVIGTGHAGASLMANLFITGRTKYKRDLSGLKNLVNDFGTKIRTEINPGYYDTYYSGGELGYSLSFAYGMSLDNDYLIPCIIGDGEAETATLSASLKLVKLLPNNNVLPILNLNGYKMGSESIYSMMSNSELIRHFNSFGYKTFIVTNDKEMYKVLNKIDKYKNPFIIYKSIKGYTCPIEGLKSHKNPLSNVNAKTKLNILTRWLKSYNVSEIITFDPLEITYSKKELILPNINKYESIKSIKSNISILKYYLNKIMSDNNFYVFSPDEIVSNKLEGMSKVIEILSENVLEGLYEGYIQNDNHGIYITYEAFAPIISSMVSQYMKYLYESKKYNRIKKDSLTYILTSTCYENNYSHQNPEFIHTLISKEFDFINVLYPKDSNNLLKCVSEVLKLKDHINIITVSKGLSKQYQSLEEANTKIEILKDVKNPDLIIAVSGDYLLSEAYKIIEKSNKKIKLVYVTNIKLLDGNGRFKESLSTKEFNKYFDDVKIIYLFHGYKSVIRDLMFKRNRKVEVYGYMDKSNICGSVTDKIYANMALEGIIYE